ncbi:phosphoadenosine phosphosulfate reductase domain-containing protein [Bacillus cabrialesii]|uniref:phosphoadenosine phosphosulfate reductase domain-containing protein n=1 Tax=Bacillus cabrialesii TaxID=2487276 RepID=UPI0028F99FF0|nr:phosphoadenosine phosphosulfate reductase family protein [Bacillus cabrialesii]MDU0154018.1 phosphoadenosine phosphosulfate reductase family protein [Bacillus cabrialesii]
MKGYKIRLAESRAFLLSLYLNEEDTRPWACAWSGGKDSTTVLGILISVLEALPIEKRNRKTYVIMSDTAVENPILEKYMYDQMKKLKTYVTRKNLPIEVCIVQRPVENSYFVLTLGRGYFMPQNNGKGRWCTERLKIRPQNEILRKINPSYILIGTRLSESTKREQSIKKWSVSERIGEHASLPKTNTFMVIVDWTIEDVWQYLGENQIGWSSTSDVRTLYKEATGECGINNPKGVEAKAINMEGCGARFGCWLCPVILKDRSTEELSKTHMWMEPLSEWREIQIKVFGAYKPPRPPGQSRKERSKRLRRQEAINEQIKLITKAGYNRAGKRMKDGQGTFTVEARKWLFQRLIETQNIVNRLREYEGLQPIILINQDEIELIYALWEEDESNYPHLLTNDCGLSIDMLSDLVDGEIFEGNVTSNI